MSNENTDIDDWDLKYVREFEMQESGIYGEQRVKVSADGKIDFNYVLREGETGDAILTNKSEYEVDEELVEAWMEVPDRLEPDIETEEEEEEEEPEDILTQRYRQLNESERSSEEDIVLWNNSTFRSYRVDSDRANERGYRGVKNKLTFNSRGREGWLERDTDGDEEFRRRDFVVKWEGVDAPGFAEDILGIKNIDSREIRLPSGGLEELPSEYIEGLPSDSYRMLVEMELEEVGHELGMSPKQLIEDLGGYDFEGENIYIMMKYPEGENGAEHTVLDNPTPSQLEENISDMEPDIVDRIFGDYEVKVRLGDENIEQAVKELRQESPASGEIHFVNERDEQVPDDTVFGIIDANEDQNLEELNSAIVTPETNEKAETRIRIFGG